ncbi:MAG TPA: hypothetical protein VJL90_09610 [Pseudorhodoplanes sp.]|nr:hypothetical protein [Pseudorhodoplanes sp.]
MPGIGIVRVCCAGALLLATLAPDGALSQSLPRPGTSSNACKVVIDDDDAKPVPGWKRFAWEEACVEISGELTAIYQKQKASASRIPLISSRQGTVTNASELTTLNPSIDINTTRQTALGELKTTFSVEYNKTTTDGNNGLNTLSDATVSWAGIKAGYTDTQMYFWDGDFQFSATAPNRTVGLAGYEFKLGENWTFTLAYETGLPMTQVSGNKFVTVFPDDPVGSARLYYDADDVQFQLAGLVHEARIDGTHPLLTLLGRPTQFKELGWAATVGLTTPVKWGQGGQDGNAFSMQATYAVNASPYLGTAADLSSLASTIPVLVTTEGWSIVGSYHHVWSEHWESNVFASYLALDLSARHFHPTIRTRRYAGNLIWKPVDDTFKIGGEVGYVESEIDPGGPLGLLRGVSGKGVIGYLFATWSF